MESAAGDYMSLWAGAMKQLGLQHCLAIYICVCIYIYLIILISSILLIVPSLLVDDASCYFPEKIGTRIPSTYQLLSTCTHAFFFSS